MSARKWTQEQRQRQSQAIQRWKPWKQSTGPKSPGGKAVAARNAWAGGDLVEMRQTIKELNQLLREQRDWLDR